MEYRVDYKQMTNAQSDYVVPDGAMHLAVDAELQNGSYMAARVPKEACDTYKNFIPLYIHNVASPQKVFTCGLKYNYDDGCFRFVILGDGEEHDILGDGETFSFDDYESELSAFCSIGNILCFTLHDEIKYAYYINGEWKLYDRLPPFINLQFAAKRIAGTSDTNDNHTVTPVSDKTNMLIANPYHMGNISIEYNDLLNVDNSSYGGACADETYCPPQSALAAYDAKENAVFAVLNKFITGGLEMGCLTFPVLVRYAVRLYNGDYLNVSPPILVFPVQATPTISRSTDNEDLSNVFHVCLERYRLVFKFDEETQTRLQELAKFEIVDGIDIFLSEQIYTIRTDHLLNRHKKMGDELYTPSFIRSRDFLNVPDVANFYHFKSFKRDLICNAREEEYIELGTNSEEIERLRYINTRTRLEVNSTSNSKVYADGMLAYNSRLLAYGVGTELGEMFDLRIMTPPILNIHDEVVEHVESDESFTLPEAYVQDNLYYNILPKQDAYDEGTAQSIRTGMTVRNGSSLATATIKGTDNTKQKYLPLYFYYPHTNGLYYYYEATNHTVGGKPSVLSGRLALQTSETDTSSYWFYPNRDSLASKISAIGPNESVPDSNTNTRVYYANLIKESEVNQPMTFADGNSVMCGNKRVITVATSAMETSRGQFGQYPLFAFCTDGVFAISVGADGTLQSCVPYSYDVLVDKHSICNVERDIVFITKQGVVSIGEGRTLLLNADKRARYAYDNDAQRKFVTATCADMGLTLPDLADLPTYLTTGARMAYDSAHARLIVYNPGYAYSYVYNYAEQSWCIITETFALSLNDADRCRLVRYTCDYDDGGLPTSFDTMVYDYSYDDVVEAQSALLMSRPIKMGAPDTLKTLSSVIQHGVFDCGHVAQAIYGSNDNRHWTAVMSSDMERMEVFRGSGYKYFRLVVFLKDFAQDESVSGCSVDVAGRMSNKLR